MESRSSDAAPAAAPPSEAPNNRRRGGNPKRKAATAALSALSNLSAAFATPSKRQSKDRNPSSLPHHMLFQSYHSGPLTRARQSPNKLGASAGSGSGAAGSSRGSDKEFMIDLNGAALAGLGFDPIPEDEEVVDPLAMRREEEENVVNLEFEAVKSRGKDVHVVPTFAGWFSWKSIHEIEKQTLVSFFDEKSEKKTPELYMTIRNSIMKKFHSNPQSQIELKDLTELYKEDTDLWQEVMEFLDHWGLINFHPFPPTGEDASKNEEDAKGDKKNASLVDKLYQFETNQPHLMSAPIPKKVEVVSVSHPALAPVHSLHPEPGLGEDPAVLMEPSIEYHCNSCQADCSRKRYHCRTQADFDLCTDCYTEGKFGTGMAPADFILMESAEGAGGATWTDEETLLLLEALELFGANWNEIADHVGTKTKAQCMLHFLEMPIEDSFLYTDEDNTAGETKSETVKEKMETEEKQKEKEEEKQKEKEEEKGLEENSDDKMETDENQDSDQKKDGDNTGDVNQTEPSDTDHTVGKDSDENSNNVLGEYTPETAINVLKDAFKAVGFLPEESDLGSFVDAGNPVMALAAFLTGLVEHDNSIVSCHRSSLKAMSESSPALQLAIRHCFILEDPPVDDVSNALPSSASKSHKGATAITSSDKNNDNSIPDTQKENDGKNEQEPSGSTKAVDVIEDNAKEQNNEKKAGSPSDADVDNKTEPPAEKEVKDESDQANGPTSNLEESVPSERTEATTSIEEKPAKTNAGNGDDEGNKEIIRLKRAAATALAAAAVKAKFLAKQEEDQIRQLVTVIIEKQFRKMEAKLAMFAELDSIISHVREQAEKLKIRLVQERSQLMTARQQVNPNQPSMAANRLAAAYANAVAGGARPPNMVSDRLQTMPTRRP